MYQGLTLQNLCLLGWSCVYLVYLVISHVPLVEMFRIVACIICLFTSVLSANAKRTTGDEDCCHCRKKRKSSTFKQQNCKDTRNKTDSHLLSEILNIYFSKPIFKTDNVYLYNQLLNSLLTGLFMHINDNVEKYKNYINNLLKETDYNNIKINVLKAKLDLKMEQVTVWRDFHNKIFQCFGDIFTLGSLYVELTYSGILITIDVKKISGKINVEAAEDLSYMEVGFMKKPDITMNINIGFFNGFGLESKVRAQILQIVTDCLVWPQTMVVIKNLKI